ncbi:6-hydroxymethylpterin diphosphokinase MptE-like protein [Desulfosporosinus sp. FKB]|uniref:motility associated factor glycosyltransferase family protein n=1 Tax=Desulfosporosinus sp. FKB TaxID=1969835 RepID=UPI001482A963|nr:6-hydroxymethylpterin diphosphokinase MptE-like protein [Desulfosporosinus sp. FKB]
MTFFEKNLAFLMTQGFEEQVLNQPLESSSVSLFTGKTGYYTATKQIEGQEFLLHSAYDPLDEASRLIVGEDVASYSTIFLFGLGLGYHLIELLERTPPSSLIFVLESDWDVVRAAMHVIDFEEILATGRVVLAFGKMSEIRVILDGLFVMGEVMLKLQRIGFLYFAQKYRTEYSVIQEMRSSVLGVLQYHRHGYGIDIGWSVQGLTNFVKHIPYLAKTPSVYQITNTWHKPVVIVLAGPSLTKNIAVLKEWQDRVTIFCVNTVFNKLLDYGIIPDATFSIDRAPIIPEQHYKRDEPIPESIVFVANPVVDSRSASLFKHHLFCFGGGEYFEYELAQDMGNCTLSMGLSVTHFAYNFANQIGAPAIILIGQDLAFSPEGRTHSSGSVYDKVKVNLETEAKIIYLEGYYGEKVPSNITWKMFRDWYEINLERFPSLVINATEGGVKIKGTIQLTLQEALEKYVGVQSPKKDSFVDWLATVDRDIVYEDGIEEIRKSFMARIKKLDIAELVYTRASDLYNYVHDFNIPLEFKKRYLDKMYEIAHNIMADNWIFSLFRPEYIRMMGDYINLNTDGNEKNPEKIIINRAKILHDMFLDMCLFLGKLRRILEDAVEKLNLESESLI